MCNNFFHNGVLYNKLSEIYIYMNKAAFAIILWGIMLLVSAKNAGAQSATDTIRLGAGMYQNKVIPAMLMPEVTIIAAFMDPKQKEHFNKLRNAVYATYPYALAAAAILKDVNTNLDNMPDRRSRKTYLKSIDKKLDATFKEPLKNMSIDQGHVLIKLIDRQSGQNCYSIIKEMKGGLSAMVWQGVGVFFNNNLHREYDPTGDDKELEGIVQELEASNAYRYQVYQQQALLRRVADNTNHPKQ